MQFPVLRIVKLQSPGSHTSTDASGGAPPAGRARLASDGSGTPTAFGWWSNGKGWLEVPGVGCFSFAPPDRRVTVVPERGTDTDVLLDAYLGVALPFVLQAGTAYELVHGSAVRTPGGVIAFSGFTGVGKTTVAHGLAARGHELWADDAVAMRVDRNGAPSSLALPFVANLRPETQGFLPSADPVEPWQTAPFAALVLLDASGTEKPTVPREPSPARALEALLPNAFRFVPRRPEDRRATVEAYLELLSRVPVFWARYRRGPEGLSALLDIVEREILSA
jgi:hypothetical protein